MSSLQQSSTGDGVELLQKIWPDLTPHEAKRWYNICNGDIASCIRAISSKRAEDKMRPGQDGEATSLLRSMIPALTDDDASKLLAAKNDDVEKAADAYFKENAPRSRTNSTNSTPVIALPRSRSGSNASGLSGFSSKSTKSGMASKMKRKPMRNFGVSVMDLMSLPEHRDQTLPRIVVYLCEFLLSRASRKAESSPRAVMADIREMIQAPLDPALFSKARQKYNEGQFYDCDSGICMFRLLKAFIRELPSPLIPRSFYDDAMACAHQHMLQVVSEVKDNPKFYLFLESQNIKGDRAAAISSWFSDYWTAPKEASMPQGLTEQCNQLKKIVEIVAFSVHQSFPDLAEFFFSLPRITRNVVEYLCVCFVKLDLMSRRGNDDNGKGIPEVLALLAETLAPHMLKPINWTATGGSQNLRLYRKRMQEVFLLSFFYFLKRKHNLMSARERLTMDKMAENSESKMIGDLLFEHVSEQTKLSQAFEHVISSRPQRSITPISMQSGANSDVYSFHDRGQLTPNRGTQSPCDMDPQLSMSPPVTRQVLDSMIEVRLDKETFRPDDTWSFYAESGDEAYGLSPAGSLASSPNLSRKMSPTLPDSDESLFEVDVDEIKRKMAGDREKVLCSWEATFDERLLGDDYIIQHAPCLSRWIEEPFLPYDASTKNNFFALEDAPDTAAFKYDAADRQDCEFSVPPGELLLPLLGPEFSHEDSGPQAFLPMFGDMDDVVHNTPQQTPRRPHSLNVMNAINYDYAMQFPRTHADTASRRSAISIVERFLNYPIEAKTQKIPYFGDAEVGLLNHALPTRFAKGFQACAICANSFGFVISSSKKSFCRYCSRVLCRRCCSRKFVVPSYIMAKGDFNVHSICRPCENHLQKHLYTPCLEFDRISPNAAAIIGTERLTAIKRARAKAIKHLYYNILPDCPSRHTLISLIPQSCLPYVTIFPDSHSARVSLADLCELQTRHIQHAMENLEELLRNHVEHCYHCRQVTRHCGAGTFCVNSHEDVDYSPPVSANTTLVFEPTPINPAASPSRSTDRTPTRPQKALHDPKTPQFSPIGIESIIDNGHTPSKAIAKLEEFDELVLCRTCALFCHRECFRSAEAQCENCIKLRPDVMKVERCYTPETGYRHPQHIGTAYLWDVDCDKTWYDTTSHANPER